MSQCPRLHVEVHGDRGPHVLLVHGMLSARSHWLPNRDALCEYARPVIVELYGHGRSPSPSDRRCYHPDQYVAQFERIRQAIGVERWCLVGQSLGAALTIRYALAHAERVLAQAFTNSASAFHSGDLARALGAAPRRARPESFADPASHPMSPTRNRRIDPEVRRALEADIQLHDAEGLARTSAHTLPHTSLSERIGEIQVPTLLLVGVREKQFRERREFISKQLRGLEVAELDAGHGVNLDAADAFNQHLRAFIERHTRSDRGDGDQRPIA